jgi:ankyrin repeat protein
LLDTAILGNDVLLMKTLLNAKASPNQSNAHGATPLNTLIQSKLPSRLETLKLSRLSILLDAGASVGGHDKKGHSLLRKAASAGTACSIGADFIKRIITAGANPWVPDGDGVTPFEAAVRAKASDDVLLAMLEVNTLAASATVDKCVDRLLSSLKEGNEALAIAMLKAGANVSLPDSSGESALKYICMFAEPAVASRMVPHLQCDTATLGRHTEQLVKAGRVETLRILQQAGARLYWLCALSEYPLMLACKQPAAIELVKVLLDAGMPLTDRNSEGRTVLFYAVNSGKPALVRLLLDRGANLRAVDHQGMTVLMLHSCVEVMEALLERLAKWPRRRKMTTT